MGKSLVSDSPDLIESSSSIYHFILICNNTVLGSKEEQGK